GSIEVTVRSASFKAHGGHREVFVDDASIRVILDQQIDRSIDLLAHMAAQAASAGTTGGRKLFHSLLFQAGPQLGFAAALFPVAFVALGQLAMKGPVLFAGAGGHKIGDTHIDAYTRG